MAAAFIFLWPTWALPLSLSFLWNTVKALAHFKVGSDSAMTVAVTESRKTGSGHYTPDFTLQVNFSRHCQDPHSGAGTRTRNCLQCDSGYFPESEAIVSLVYSVQAAA